ncbi:unnamed protein product [Periconia digitata]|uniref:Uncharacterized protein n=1 Tax=Periconia digitata TaxID=1303443 RepID=A0A9W4UB27_9PLEO|nr:unnamed protein product [Periconia digitata]
MAHYNRKPDTPFSNLGADSDSTRGLTGRKSPGVLRIEALSRHISSLDRVFIFIGVFLIAYAYGLDGTLRFTYQPNATDKFKNHSLLSTVNVVRAVIAAATQPTTAKIADVFGRVEMMVVSILFYVAGTIVEATSDNVEAFAAGAFLYQVGYTSIVLLLEIVVADTTSLRSRLFFSYVPATPFIINAWVSGDVGKAVLAHSNWRWGIGMWCIIYPVCALPLLMSLTWVTWKAYKSGDLARHKTPLQLWGWRRLAVGLFWQIDAIGLLLLIAATGLILTPLTLAGGQQAVDVGLAASWSTGRILAPLIAGVLCVPAFILWEQHAPHPLLPFHLVKDRAVWGALGIGCILNFAYTCQSDYLFTVLRVGFNESDKSATRISSLYSFASVITGVLLGLVVYRVRRLKPFILVGTCLYMAAFGLLIHFRGGADQTDHKGIVGAQVMLGTAGGLFPYPAQASIQAATKHEHVAIVTGLYLASYNIGSALGNTVSGAIWTQVLPREFKQRIANSTEAHAWYAQPLAYIAKYPPGTPNRDTVIEVYKDVQRLMCIVGICLCVLLILFACVLRNPFLTDDQSFPGAEEHIEEYELQETENNASRFAKN